MKEKTNKKILYAASTVSHLERFHQPYIRELKKRAEVLTMGDGEGADFAIAFDKHFFSLSNLKSILAIRKILKRERFDAVIVHTTLAAFLIRAAMLCMHRPYVMNVVHGYLFPKKLGGLKDRILLMCEKWMRGMTDDIAVMNAEDMEIAQKHRLCRGKVYFLNGMGIPRQQEIEGSGTDAFAELPIAKEDFVCTFVGELSHRKNQSFLIRATKTLSDEGLPIKLVLIGEGADRPLLEQLIAENALQNRVFLVGSKANVPAYLAATDLYVSASSSEGLPFNIMEAMAMGLPILASNTKGQNDLLDAGCLYPLDDEAAFCEGVRHIHREHRYGAGTAEYPILKRYTLEAVFEDTVKILTSGWIDHEN